MYNSLTISTVVLAITNQRPLLQQLLQLTRQHVYHDAPAALGTVGVFHCHQAQRLHSVPIQHPTLIVVLHGEKHLYLTSERSTRCHAGDMLLLPGRYEVQMENLPLDHEYLALCLSFSPNTISQFLNGVGHSLNWQDQPARIHANAPDDLLLSLLQRLQWPSSASSDNVFLELRQQELLALCARHHLLGNLLRNRHPNTAQRIASLIGMDCARAWKMADICNELAMSETTLRRELNREATGFREILEQTRLTAGLCLLQETRSSITDIAASVGYDSPSRFAARFRQRFGMSPVELKRSREKVADSGATLTD